MTFNNSELVKTCHSYFSVKSYSKAAQLSNGGKIKNLTKSNGPAKKSNGPAKKSTTSKLSSIYTNRAFFDDYDWTTTWKCTGCDELIRKNIAACNICKIENPLHVPEPVLEEWTCR